MAPIAGHRVIVFVQENKTTDFYFPTLAKWGAAITRHAKLGGVHYSATAQSRDVRYAR
ncbi:MAG: hypothetical protein QOF88_895 [Mycobacterium sp.]|jgi:hypothetical protein|nr:hypothetical protein [Mycobacterium sp.]